MLKFSISFFLIGLLLLKINALPAKTVVSTSAANDITTLTKIIAPPEKLGNSCFTFGVVTEAQHNCTSQGGHFHQEVFQMKDTGVCTKFNTCLLPATPEDVESKKSCVKFPIGFNSENTFCSILFCDVIHISFRDDLSFIEKMEGLSQFYDSFYFEIVPASPTLQTNDYIIPWPKPPSIQSSETLSNELLTTTKTIPVTITTKSISVTIATKSIPDTVSKTIPVTVSKTIPVTVSKTIPVTVSKTIPVTVSKTIPVTVSKSIPITISKTIPVTVTKSVPITTTKNIITPTETKSIKSTKILPPIEKGHSCFIPAMVTSYQRDCEDMGGHYHKESFQMKDTGVCRLFYTCLYPATPEDVANKRLCAKFAYGVNNENTFCSFRSSVIHVSARDDLSFIENLEELSKFYDSFYYEVVPAEPTLKTYTKRPKAL